ncbi:MAG: aminotransferase class I/II-fold pyridoxal phosphate-dependent enzyme, partial [Pseudomonadota bacterium]
MDFQKSSRLQSINVSEIVKIAVHARQLKASGRPVVILGAGEPDFDTPENIIEAAVKAMHDGETHYTPLDGTPELKTAIQTKFLRDNNLGFEISEISAGAGAKQIIFNALMATLEPGDEVITPSPFWTSYEDIVKICGGRMVTVPCGADQEFLLKPEDLESAITPRTKWLLLNSPGNP